MSLVADEEAFASFIAQPKRWATNNIAGPMRRARENRQCEIVSDPITSGRDNPILEPVHNGGTKAAAKRASAVVKLKPDFSIANYLELLSYAQSADQGWLEEGLRKAGLPE